MCVWGGGRCSTCLQDFAINWDTLRKKKSVDKKLAITGEGMLQHTCSVLFLLAAPSAIWLPSTLRPVSSH